MAFVVKFLSPKLMILSGDYGSVPTHSHWCPACKSVHCFAVEQPFSNGERWAFDGNLKSPTFSPSMNIRIGPFPARDGKPGRTLVCHYFLRAGQIQYLPDCTHAMAGQSATLPDIPAEAVRWADEVTFPATMTDPRKGAQS